MANLRETPTWEAGIYQLETSDPVMGGENGIDNRAPRQLANRTLWLKNELARQIGLINQSLSTTASAKADKSTQFTAGVGLTGGGDLSTSRTISLGTPSKITATSTNAAVSNTHSHEIDKASTSVAGIVQLVDNLSSNANNQALTAKQGKILNDTKLASNANAVSASKLHIPRTINGVAFDGTANITVGLPTFSTTINQSATTLTNANDAVGQGGFSVRHLTSTTTNKPSGISHAMMSCVYDSKYASQLATDWRTNKLYSRVLNNGQWTSWKEVAYSDGNVATASRLQTARTINGVSFDGTANITIFDSTKAAKSTQLTAGAGLIGGGDLSTSRTISLGTPSKITATSTNAAVSNTHSHEIDKASTSVAGIVQLVDNLSSNANNQALTANQGKVLKQQIDTKLGNSGTQHLNGVLWIGQGDTWQKITFKDGRTNANRTIDLEINPSYFLDSNTSVGSTEIKFKFNDATRNGNTARYITFPSINNFNQNVAYHSWVQNGFLPKTANAASASKLQTARTINGVAFDGTANITITDNTKVGKAGNETIAGVKTFSSSPKAPTPATTSKDTTVATTAFVHSAIVVNDDHNIGMVAFFAMNAAPTGWLKANGAAVSRSTYAKLFAKIGTTFGAGDGRTTFNLPDLRGEFVRGFDDGRNVDGGRRLGTAQGDAIRNITGEMDTGSNQGLQLFDGVTASGVFGISKSSFKRWTADQQGGATLPQAFDFNASRVVPTANENRPRNIALLACIKY